MSLPDVVSREQWLEARRQLLAQEKEYTRKRDALNADRRRLPMVKIDQEYVFEGPDGQVSLADLFGGRRQLVVQHVMFGPDWDEPCPGCSASLAALAPGVLDHLATRKTTFVLTSRAPYAKIAAKAAERGWSFPWYSSFGSDFNYDYGVTLDAARGLVDYNYRGLWLLDALLQFQPFMFGHGFAQMLAGSAAGNPGIVARPVTWSAGFIDHHVAVLNAIFAVIRLLLGLGIAVRATVRLALAASVAWSLAVRWLGEGFGGLR